MEISKDMLIVDILREYPDTIDKLLNIGLACIGCPASVMETLEEAAIVHGLDPDEVIEYLNDDEEFLF